MLNDENASITANVIDAGYDGVEVEVKCKKCNATAYASILTDNYAFYWSDKKGKEL